jgi:hypothetical protein
MRPVHPRSLRKLHLSHPARPGAPLLSRETSPALSGLFISHVSQEQSVANVLKKYLHDIFGSEIPIFVSSDKTSIGGGKKWFTHIIDNLHGKKVVLCLVSQESKSREWVHFEAGYGGGHGALIIPIAIRNLPLGALSYPLIGYQARSIDDLQAIVDDISRETRLTPNDVDYEQYLRDISEAEDKVQHKNVVMCVPSKQCPLRAWNSGLRSRTSETPMLSFYLRRSP